MKKYIFILLSLFIGTANAITIDPTTGLSGSFSFGGTGDIGSYQTSPAEGWDITVGTDSTIDVRVDDCCVVGDTFALVFDGVATSWTSSGGGTGSSLFFGEYISLFLAAGTHTFDFMLTGACCSSGGASYAFSAASAVPVPAAVWLFGSGLAGLLGFGRRRTKIKTVAA